MRSLLAVAVGGVLIGLVHWNEFDGLPWPLQLGFMAFAALAVGYVAGRRGWLAALAAFVVGNTLWVAVELRPSLPWAASDVWGWEQWSMFLVTLLPTAFGAAVLGWLGGRVGHSLARRFIGSPADRSPAA